MHEPTPKHLATPASEPTIRVGIVLKEDQMQSIDFECSREISYNLNSQTKIYSGSISIKDKDLLSLSPSHLNNKSNLFTIEPSSTQILTPQTGIKLSSVVAGRGFHWAQKIQASYPGKLEFRNNNSALEVVNEISFEDYLACVVNSEMGTECPIEFMKAQIVAARSWAYVFLRDKHPNSNFEVCNDDDCQRYQGSSFLGQTAIKALLETRGEFLTYSNNQSNYVVPAYYYKTCGGITENPEDIFGFKEEALEAVIDSLSASKNNKLDHENYIDLDLKQYANYCCGQNQESHASRFLGKVDQGGTHFRWKKIIANQEIVKNLLQKNYLKDIKEVLSITPLKRSFGSKAILLEIEYLNLQNKVQKLSINTQYKIREALSPSFLPSSAFIVSKDAASNFEFQGAGWGHGVGLCQVGGVNLALAGKSYKDILKHYFPKATIHKAY